MLTASQRVQRNGSRVLMRRALNCADIACHQYATGKIESRGPRFAEYQYKAWSFARESAQLAFLAHPELREVTA